MKRKAKVFLREYEKEKSVNISSLDKPEISDELFEKWQRIINLIAKIINVPSALLMRINDESMEVFIKGHNKENPYEKNARDLLGQGLYCETVVGTKRELLIENALNHEKWKNAPDVNLNMISYYGLPIIWPDDEFFGTICILDNKTNRYSDEYKELLREFKSAIEVDLKLLLYKEKLEFYADMDILTLVYNRRKIEHILVEEYNRFARYDLKFSIAIFDINKFKIINDNYGHGVGDEVLKVFADTINKRIRSVDSFGRWGGDEFLLICPNTDLESINTIINEIFDGVVLEMNKIVKSYGFCYGLAEIVKDDTEYQNILRRADKNLYKCKKAIAI